MDSERMHALTQATVRDSAGKSTLSLFYPTLFTYQLFFITAMKQIAYLTMVFLPASFVAVSPSLQNRYFLYTQITDVQTAFGMNVTEINQGSVPSLSHYFAAAFPLTAVTIWIVVALQIQLKEPVISPSNPTELSRMISGPSGHDLRPAYTNPEGHIIMATSESESESRGGTHCDIQDHGVYDDDCDGGMQKAGLWKRLLWPVILIQYHLMKYKQNREKKRLIQPEQRRSKDTSREKRNLSHFSLPFFNSHVERYRMTAPAVSVNLTSNPHRRSAEWVSGLEVEDFSRNPQSSHPE